jgi:hypothetical protein
MAIKSYVLDYSAGRLTGAQIKAYNDEPEPGARYVGAVRYAGSAGQQGKEATKAELDSYVSNDLGVALVYETTSGWWRGGRNAGVAAAKAIKADATAWGYWGKIRAYIFTADEDVTPATLPLFKAAIAGAVSVLGYDLVGAYGEADVIEACVGGKLCRWGWQTRAWSGGRVSQHAHLLQLVGYVYPGGFDADRSLVLKEDWGQYPAPKQEETVSFEEVWSGGTIPNPAWENDKLESVGVAPPVKSAYKPGEILAGIGANLGYVQGLVQQGVGKLSATLAAQGKALDALTTVVMELTSKVSTGEGMSEDELRSFVRQTIAEAVSNDDAPDAAQDGGTPGGQP